MGQTTADARKEVEAARRGVSTELDQLGVSTRKALDIPAKVRRNPVQTAGVTGGAAFLLLGGPRRAAKAVERKLFPRRAARPPTLLPKDVEKSLKNVPADNQDQVRGVLERDFATYLRKEHAKEAPNARQSIWKTYDLVVGIVGAAAARELVKKLFEIPQETKVEAIEEEGEAVAEAEEKIADAKTG
jgi:hypothetical protein